mmetsp:Transcript_61035/g.135996  ORF Transcript_61035/g.135996 Transcript_61035/m.135996 type:complete len:111 (-) Transcript_61035:524-856(-)
MQSTSGSRTGSRSSSEVGTSGPLTPLPSSLTVHAAPLFPHRSPLSLTTLPSPLSLTTLPSPFTAHHSPLTSHRSPLTPPSPLTPYLTPLPSPLTAHPSSLTAPPEVIGDV